MAKLLRVIVLCLPMAVFGDEVIRAGTDFITSNDAGKTYTLNYRCDTDGRDYSVTIKLPTDFLASVESRFSSKGRQAVEYNYEVRNDRKSRQPIQFIWVPVGVKDAEPRSPKEWDGDITRQADGYEVGWSVDERHTLQPGRGQSFALSARSLPILGKVALMAPMDTPDFCGEGPNPIVSAYLEENLLNIGKNRVFVDAVVPGIKIDFSHPELMLDVLALEAGPMASKGGRQDVADELTADVAKAAASWRAQDVRSSLESLRHARELVLSHAGRDERDGRPGPEENRRVLDALAFDLEYIADAMHRSGHDENGDHEHHDR